MSERKVGECVCQGVNNVYYQMKGDLCDLLKETTLKSEIYRTISGSKFGNVGHLLKNSVKKGLKYVEFASEGTEHASDIINSNSNINPTLRTNRSNKKLNSSANDSSLSHKKMSKEVSREKLGNTQRSDRRVKAVSGLEGKEKNRNYLLVNSQKPSKEKGKKKSEVEKHFPASKTEGQKQKGEKNALSKSKSKLSCKMNLSSIIQQSSSEEQLVTPQHKKSQLIHPKEEDKTAKKQRRDQIPQQVRKRIAKSFAQPEKYIRLAKSESLTVSYRVLKRKLIEIEIYVHKSIEALRVYLEKGNLECQSIQESYSSLAPHTVLALFSSVRDVNLLDLYSYPQLILDLTISGETIRRCLILPYSFLNFAEERENIPPRRSRIRTKLCLERLPINPKKLRVLSSVFKAWSKRQFKGEAEFQTHFGVGEHEFRLRLVEEKGTFTIELEGRGEEKLTKVIDFFSKLIC